MGTITICEDTTKTPLQMIGKYAGICWGADTEDEAKNYNRAIDCINSGHGRTTEFPDVYMIIDGYSARVMRELYTHIGGAPTRLQASTRYIDYESGFDYIVPPSIERDLEAKTEYIQCMEYIQQKAENLINLGILREDVANLLPLGMKSKMVYKVNLRTLTDMSRQRMCSRAYWEFRELFMDIYEALTKYSPEWSSLVREVFYPKCEAVGYCTEKNRGKCRRKPMKEEYFNGNKM